MSRLFLVAWCVMSVTHAVEHVHGETASEPFPQRAHSLSSVESTVGRSVLQCVSNCSCASSDALNFEQS
eukprot:133038-Rhodomonas_salina.1